MKDKGNELFANVKISVNLFNLFASVVGKLVVTLLLETKILKKKDTSKFIIGSQFRPCNN